MDLTVFEKFLADEEAWEMFIYGPAGSGKTTMLSAYIEYCIAANIPYKVCAHTHKACGVLRSVLPAGASVETLHKFLKKRPTIDTNARSADRIESNVQHGDPDMVHILFVDEFSMVGEADLMDVRAKQDPDYEGEPGMKVVWIGDQHQLPPVRDAQSVIPDGPYQIKLTEIYRTKGALMIPLSQLVSFIEGAAAVPLVENECFTRGVEDLAECYKSTKGSKVLLAYTNEQVQNYNFMIAGMDKPMITDQMFSPTVHREYELVKEIPRTEIAYCDQVRGDPLTFDNKYKTLDFIIHEKLCDFYQVLDIEDGETWIYPVIFGTNNYKLAKDNAGKKAIEANKAIEREMKVKDAGSWSKQNYKHKLARNRAKAWRKYLTLKETVICMDFPYAMTVHKSQGSTYDHIILDSEDLSICRHKNFMLYLKLFYVAMSRARYTVTTN